MSTIKDVAGRAQVSKSTASYVLSGNRPVSDEIRKRVLRAAQELDYQPSSTARSLATGRTRIVGLSLPLTSPALSQVFIPEFISAIADVLREHGYRLLLFTSTEHRVEDVMDVVRSGHADGMILMEVEMQDRRVDFLRQAGFPFVAMGRCEDCAGLDYVDVDAEGGVYTAVTHLLSLGHHRIGFLTHSRTEVGFVHRSLLGYRAALRANGFPVDENLIVRCECTFEEAEIAASHFLAVAPRVTAIICEGGDAVHGVVLATREHGLRIPEDLSLVASYDFPFRTAIVPNLTSLGMPVIELVRESAAMMFKKLRGEDLEEHGVVLPRPLIVGESTAPRK